MKSGLLLCGLFLLLTWLELRLPLRRTVSPKPARLARNLLLGAIAFGILALLQPPVLDALTNYLAAHTLAFYRDPSPSITTARVILSFMFLDYTLWIWHWLNHKVPFLWRFHLVHHVDRDLDASTALRFHFGEFTLSILFRALQFAAIGGDLAVLGAWQSTLFASILFHHSNLRLPPRLDRLLALLLVTPRMHGIHHSNLHAETDSNWSSLLTIWDRLHRTLRLDIPQARIHLGVPAYSNERDVTFPHLLAMPFTPQRDDWHEAPN